MKAIDMTQGNLRSAIIRFALPLFFANLIQNLCNIADKIWVGKCLGKVQLTAVGTIGPMMYLILALSVGLAVGTTVLVSQNTGAENKEGVISIIDTSLMVSIVLSVLMMGIGFYYFEFILQLIDTATDVLSHSRTYMRIILFGIPFVFFTSTVAAALHGTGDAKSPTIIVGIAAVLNIALTPVLITGIGLFPSLGVAGAAIATIVSQAVGFILSYRKILQLRKKYIQEKKLYFYRNFIGSLFKLGLPASLQQGLLSIGNMLILTVVHSFENPDISSGFWAGNTFDTLAFLPAIAIGSALSTAAGQNTGTKNMERVQETAKIGLKYTGLINGVVLIIGYVFAKPIARMFLNDPAAIEQTVVYLRIFCFYYLPFGLMTAFNAVAQGIGNTVLPMVVTVLSTYIVRIPLAKYLAYHTSFGIKGVYIGMALSPLFGLLLIFIYFYAGIWKKRVAKGV